MLGCMQLFLLAIVHKVAYVWRDILAVAMAGSQHINNLQINHHSGMHVLLKSSFPVWHVSQCIVCLFPPSAMDSDMLTSFQSPMHAWQSPINLAPTLQPEPEHTIAKVEDTAIDAKHGKVGHVLP